ncbi:MAG: FAD:protein FMN transferase [Planctomycetota bacterium]|jgi:thiamine biosynthesis lipoprotein
MTEPEPQISFIESNCDSITGVHRFCHEAMATTFEIFILHSDGLYARQAAQAAFSELDRLEGELSRFVENSDISRINSLPAGQGLLIGLETFECLELSVKMSEQTSGAFDITVGSLLNCWLNEDKNLRTPSEEQLNLARQHTGMHLLKLDKAEHTVELLAAPVQIDLGGIGKGYAVDRMAQLLGEWSTDVALISGGSSSVLAVGTPPEQEGWPVSLVDPADRKHILARLLLRDRAVGGSGLEQGNHIIDPRIAKPVESKRAAWSCAPTGAIADALSTAFMIMSPDQIRQYCVHHQQTMAMALLGQAGKDAQEEMILRIGGWEELSPVD